MDDTLEAILEFTGSLTYDELPSEVTGRARDIFTDALACALGGRECNGAAVARALARQAQASGDQGAVIGERLAIASDLAAFLNTAMIRYLDYNDAYPGGHPSDMLGALIAVSNGQDVSGKDFVVAMSVAYEVFIRLSESVNLKVRAIDQGYAIAVGVVAGMSKLLKLPNDVTRAAVTIAASSGVPLRCSRAGELSDLKGTATALACQSAVRYLRMAQAGLTGPEAPFDGRHGITELISGEPGPVGIAEFKTSWKIMGTRLKYWPVAYNMQASIWAALELRERIDSQSVSSVVIYTDKFSHHESGSERAKWDPHTRETADHSLPYVFARALERGAVEQSIFEEDAIRDPEVRPLMNKITVEIDPELTKSWPSIMGVRVEAAGNDGATETVAIRDVKGHERNPLGREDIEAKFLSLAAPVIGSERAAAAFEGAWTISEQSRVSDVLDRFIP